MEKDIVPGLLELIENEFNSKVLDSDKIKNAVKLLRDKQATYKDANDFAIEVGEILAEVLGKNITAEILPDGKMYYNIADRVLNPTLSKNRELISSYAADVQTELNQNAGLRMKGQKVELNQDRIDGIVSRVSNEDDFERIKWILEEPVKNFCQSIVDDTIKKNVEFHAKSGLKPKIIRRSTGNCCDWCDEIVGVYEYPDVPKDVYRRHRYCRCTVDYYPGDERKQNAHTKEWTDPEKESKIETRKKIGIKQINPLSDRKWLKAEFSSDKKFNVHIEKHLNEYGNISSEEYLNIARRLLAEPLNKDVEGFLGEANFVFKYRKSTNDFAVGREDGKISTLFKPNDGLKYWEIQIELFKKKEG